MCFLRRQSDARTSSAREIREVISSQQPQFIVYLCTLRIRYCMAFSSFFSLARTMPYLLSSLDTGSQSADPPNATYRYSNQPWLPTTSSSSLMRSSNHADKKRPTTMSSLFSIVPRSCGPMTISDSSFLRFSPAMNLAYKARNKLF